VLKRFKLQSFALAIVPLLRRLKAPNEAPERHQNAPLYFFDFT
jgi:hypothetical protein